MEKTVKEPTYCYYQGGEIMGYYSDVRILIKEKDFNKLCKQAKQKFPDSLMEHIDIKTTRTGKDTKYIYFGWDCIKFYYEEAEYIENFVKDLNDFHFVRVGEELTDIDEHYNLQTDVDCIQIVRYFEEEIKC
jgi:hypothetical protein